MKLLKIISVMLTLLTIIHAQDITYLEVVSEKFKKKYSEETHNYNPLHVGDVWQYSSSSSIKQRSIIADTVVNSKCYFKKLDYTTHKKEDQYTHFYHWERFDSLKRASYAYDYNDEDLDGITDEELLLDSLEIPNFQSYISYRYTWKDALIKGPTEVYVSDSSWAIVFGDTVMTRRVEYLEFFLTEWVADKFGVVMIVNESPASVLSGAIIDGKTYGTIVSVENEPKEKTLTKDFTLFQNYPNPFNSSTQIKFRLTKVGYTSLRVLNILGQEVELLHEGILQAGNYTYQFDAEAYSTGLYICELTFNSQMLINKMIHLK